MNSVPRDLRDTLPETNSEVNRAATTVAVGTTGCWRCLSAPTPGDKLRHCARCKSAAYCGMTCARADWDTHKLMCESYRRIHEEALAAHVAQGGQKKEFNQHGDDVQSWFQGVPGLVSEVELLAWKSRSQIPCILVMTSPSDTDGSEVCIRMFPRSLWDEDPRFGDSHREVLRNISNESSFCPNTNYMCVFQKKEEGKPGISLAVKAFFIPAGPVRVVQIVDALTAGMRPEDLADALTWFESTLPVEDVQDRLQNIRHRAMLVHGCATIQGSIPSTTRALNTEVAYMMVDTLGLAFDIRLTGLRSAAHLNGREGVIQGADPANDYRWTARLDDGTFVSVRAENFVHIRPEAYKRAPM